jgi:hypothetical protein
MKDRDEIMNNYFENVSEDQLLKDIEEAGMDGLPEQEEYSTDTKYYIFQLGEEFLEDVDEGLYLEDDEPNYTFTLVPTHAYKFYGDFNCKFFAPKYLWDDKEGKNIETAQDMLNYFKGGRFLEVTETVTRRYDFKKVEQ